jgi:cytochrome c553
MENGEEINEVCAGCHGEFGQGGKEGEYPRLSGLPASFIAQQLHLFRDRKRPNLAMIEYIDHRQMPDKDIVDVSAYLAAIKLASKLPPIDVDAAEFDALERLLLAKQTVQIPRAEGDIAQGEKIYKKECAVCHGRAGEGDHDKAVPMLAGQYTNYLWRQVEKYLKGYRIHDQDSPDDELLAEFSSTQLRDIFAYVSVLDD